MSYWYVRKKSEDGLVVRTHLQIPPSPSAKYFSDYSITSFLISPHTAVLLCFALGVIQSHTTRLKYSESEVSCQAKNWSIWSSRLFQWGRCGHPLPANGSTALTMTKVACSYRMCIVILSGVEGWPESNHGESKCSMPPRLLLPVLRPKAIYRSVRIQLPIQLKGPASFFEFAQSHLRGEQGTV